MQLMQCLMSTVEDPSRTYCVMCDKFSNSSNKVCPYCYKDEISYGEDAWGNEGTC